jgi:hypothetical protein
MALIWFGLEDAHSAPVALLATALALLLLANFYESYPQNWHKASLWIFTGALAGALSALNSTLLMFFKTAWHAHPFPDYPLPMLIAMLERAPVWAIAGALIGLGIHLWRSARVQS